MAACSPEELEASLWLRRGRAFLIQWESGREARSRESACASWDDQWMARAQTP
jgi:hypothetical protein